MAKIVITGCSDCPYFAKIELLAEKISINVPSFVVHKIVKTRSEWAEWVNSLIRDNHWKIKESPIIWRELVDRGGKGFLIGGANEFQEYIKCYYNIMSDLGSEQMKNIAIDNTKFKIEEDKDYREMKALSTPTKVCICGATNPVVPHFVLGLASGDIIDKVTELSIVFYEKTANIPSLKSLQMGTFDLAYPLLRSISITEDFEAAFVDSSYVIIFDDIIQLPFENLEDWLKRCQEYYEYIGNVLERYCPAHVKVLLVPDGQNNPINVNLTCIHRMLERIPKFNVVGLSTPIEQHVRSVVARKLSVNPCNVHNIIVWGNLGGKKVFDIGSCRVHKYNGSIVGPEPFSVSAEKTIWDKKWLKEEMDNLIHERFLKVSQLRKRTGSELAVSNALNGFLKHWINGDQRGYIHSLTAASEGRYGIPEGMVFSVPVTFNPKGYWNVVQDAEMSEDQFKKITECIQDINEQLYIIYPWMNTNHTDLVLDEEFINSQLQTLLEEQYPKERVLELQILLSEKLTVEEKLEVSKNKDLLIITINELETMKATVNVTDKNNDNDRNENYVENDDNDDEYYGDSSFETDSTDSDMDTNQWL